MPKVSRRQINNRNVINHVLDLPAGHGVVVAVFVVFVDDDPAPIELDSTEFRRFRDNFGLCESTKYLDSVQLAIQTPSTPTLPL